MANTKCYKSLSCLLSVAVIVFIIGAILVDIFYTKPQMRSTIEDIRVEVQDIHRKIDIQSEIIQHATNLDSIVITEQEVISFVNAK